MISTLRPVLAALPLLLAACGDGGDAVDPALAKGDVQGGTISDDMLPYDTVQSQPPLAEGAEDDEDSAGADAAGEGGEETPTPDAE